MSERISEIEARLEGVTPGRWYVEGEPDEAKSVVQYTSANGVSVGTYIVDVNERDEDAEFIANAPADIAYLLAELRARDEMLDEYVAKYGEHTTDTRVRDCPACNASIRVKQRQIATLAAALGGGES